MQTTNTHTLNKGITMITAKRTKTGYKYTADGGTHTSKTFTKVLQASFRELSDIGARGSHNVSREAIRANIVI